VIFLSADDTRRVSDWSSAIACILSTYAAEIEPGSSPGRILALAPGRSLRCMPGISPLGRYMGTKLLVKSRNGHVTYLIALFDQEDAGLAYLVDGLYVTAMRTAATSAAALTLLCSRPQLDLAVLGSGLEASMHVEALSAIRSIRSLAVYSPTPESRTAFAKRFQDELGIPVRAAESPEEAVEGATHVIAAARSRDESPILFGSWLTSASLVISIGSTLPNQRELDVSVIDRADLIIADEPHELAEQTGDMLEAEARGIRFREKLFSLQDLARGALDHRMEPSPDLALFKSLGSGLQDVALAEMLADRCAEAGIGMEQPLELAVKGG
jgi:alanine dehydrogenase